MDSWMTAFWINHAWPTHKKTKIEYLDLIPNPIWYGNFVKLRNEAPSLMHQTIHDKCRCQITVPGKWVFPSPLLQFAGTVTSEFCVLNIYLLENFKLVIASFLNLFIWKGHWDPPSTQVSWTEAFQHVGHKSVSAHTLEDLIISLNSRYQHKVYMTQAMGYSWRVMLIPVIKFYLSFSLFVSDLPSGMGVYLNMIDWKVFKETWSLDKFYNN